LPYCQKFELFYSYGNFNVLLAHSYRSTNKINEAIEAYLNANQYYKLVKNDYMLNLNCFNISGSYRLLNDSYNAIFYINEAIKYFEKIKDTAKLNNARVEKIITMFYFNADIDLIIDTINVMINSKVISEVSKGELLTILASIELRNNKYEKALSLYKQAEPLLKTSIDSDMYIFIYHGISKIYECLSDSENLLLFKLKIQEAVTLKPCYSIYLEALESKSQSA
jgi:tetratricopeptide (TPR) repeat protein